MEIYFDDILINEDYYTSLSTNFALFNDTFYLGSTATNTYNVSIAKEAVTTQPNIVTIKDGSVLIATLVVDKIEENDFEYKYTLTDKMVNLEFAYDASQIFTNGSATLLEIAQDICNKAGIILATTNFRSYDKKISWYDNTRKAREYIGFIAELNGGYAQIGKDGKLYFLKQKASPVKTINFDECEDFKIGENHKISRVVYELGALKYEYGDETGNTLYLSEDNVFITEESEVEEIYNEINGFEFYSFSTSNCPIDYEIMAGQVITFTDGKNNYPTIASYDLVYGGGWYGGYRLDVASKKQEETQTIGVESKIKNLSIKVDRDNNLIQSLVQVADTLSNNINLLDADLQKQIQDLSLNLQDYQTTVSTSFEQTNTSFEMKFAQIVESIVNNATETNEKFAEQLKYIRFENGNIILGEEGNQLILKIQNDRISYQQNGSEVAYFSNNKLYVTTLEVTDSLKLGNFAFIPRANGNLSFKKVGGN